MLKKIFLCLLLCFVFVLSTKAQNKDNAILLKTLLNNLAVQHQVNFNYIEEEIIIFKLVPPDDKLSLRKKLAYISDKTKIDFKFITDDFISVINNKKLDKPFCGFLIDVETQLVIESATVHISGTNYSAFTNEKGYFELQLRSPNDIEISHVNYEKITVKPEQLYTENCPTFTLKPIINELEVVVAEVFLTKGITKLSDGSYEIKPKKFGLLPGLTEPDVFETLKQIPGINSTDETQSNINVRGGTHDQNLFLWNGIRLFQTSHFFGLISALNPHLAQTIKVVKNGSSPFYGESVSSAIDISTRSRNIEEQSASIGLNLINTDFYIKTKLSENANIELSSRRSFTDIINTPTYKSYYNRIFQNTAVRNINTNQLIDYYNDEKFYFYDFTVQYHQKINSKSDLYVDAITIYNKLDLTESKVENISTVTKNSDLNQQTIGGTISFQTNWNTKTKSEVDGYVSYYSIESDFESIESNQISNQENKIFDVSFRLKNSHQLSEKFQFNNGYQFNSISIKNYDYVNNPPFSRIDNRNLNVHALIGEIQYTSKNSKLKTNFGFRGNYIEQFKTFLIEPRLQLNYILSRVLKLEVLAERKSQTSTQIVDLSQDFLGIEKRRWTLSNNDDIPILKNSQIAVGFTFKENNWLLCLENYYKKVNGITSGSQGFQNQLEFAKINGNYTVLGTELLVQKQFKKITSWISYTYTDNNYTFDSYTPQRFPNNFEIKHTIGAALIYDYNQLKMALGSRWFTGKPNTVPLTSVSNTTILYNSPNAENLENYFQVNVSGSYHFKITKSVQLAVGLSVQNVLNSKVIINQNYRINQNTNSVEQINTYSLERTPNCFFRFSF